MSRGSLIGVEISLCKQRKYDEQAVNISVLVDWVHILSRVPNTSIVVPRCSYL